MARIFRALRRASAPEVAHQEMAPNKSRRPVPRELSPSFSRMQRPPPHRDPIIVILQNLLNDLDDEIENEDDSDENNRTDDDDDDTTHMEGNDCNTTSRKVSSHDLVRAIWGVESNYLWQVFARTRLRMARDQTFSAELKSDVTHSNSMVNMINRLRNVTMADLVLPERSGWLFDLTEDRNVWCVVADMLFCVFENDTSEAPVEVIILPGCAIRSLVYQTATPQPSSSKTISGIDKYQIIIDDSSSRRKFLFSVDCPEELDQWMSVLKSASTLDHDSDTVDDETEPETEIRRHSLHSALVTNYQGDFLTPRYVPTASTSNRLQSYSTKDKDTYGNDSDEKSQTSKSHEFKKNNAQRNSIGDIRRKLRRDTEMDLSKTAPLKATHFESSPSSTKKPGPFKKLRSFGSLESLFKSKKKDEPSMSRSFERRSSKGSLASKQSSSSSSLELTNESSLLRNAGRRSLSAIDFAKAVEKGYNSNLYRTPSDLKDQSFSTQTSVQLKDLHDASICGFLQQKVLIRWQKVWCMVCRGQLYIFKSQSPEEHAFLNIILSNCTITYLSDQDKRFKKLFVFKITRNRRKSVYLNAADKNELSRWLQVLQMESNKVHGDADSVDSGHSLSDYTNANVTYSSGPVKFSLGSTSPSTDLTSDHCQSDSEGAFHSESSRRFSLPNGFDGGNDSGYVPSADESEYKETVGGKTNVGFPRNDLPDIDPALKHVWQQDKNYLLNMVRAKLRRSRKRNDSEPFTNQPLPGPNNEGLMVMADEPEVTSSRKKQKGSGSRDVRRTMSFHGANPASTSGTKALNPPAVDSPMSSPSSRKRHKPLAVKKLAARDLENCAISGYMERRSFSGQWIRYWYVLKDGTMFCYLTPDDNVTVDILNLQGYKIAYLIDKFRGKRFVLQLSHQEYSSVYMSLETRETMTEWLECLQLATGVPPSLHGVLDDHDSPEQFSDKSSDPDYHDKCQSVKQKLLAEMLRQKHELERKQATRQKRQSGDGGNPEVMSEEEQIRDVTRLRQRRMSAQIKMDTIQKQLQSAASSGKKFPFKFGAKKKVPEGKNEHLQEQLKELSVKLEEIDRNLSSHSKPTEFLDMNQNKRQVATEEMRTSHDFYGDNNSEVNKGGAKNIKASVQKLKTKTFSKGAKSKNRKSTELQNGHVNALESSPLNSSVHELKLDLANCRLQDDEFDSENGSESHRSDSFTDLTKNKSPTSSVEDNVFSDHDESGGIRRNPRRKAVSNPATPRKEIDPNVLAEIDAFEDFTRQVLSARNAKITS